MHEDTRRRPVHTAPAEGARQRELPSGEVMLGPKRPRLSPIDEEVRNLPTFALSRLLFLSPRSTPGSQTHRHSKPLRSILWRLPRGGCPLTCLVPATAISQDQKFKRLEGQPFLIRKVNGKRAQVECGRALTWINRPNVVESSSSGRVLGVTHSPQLLRASPCCVESFMVSDPTPEVKLHGPEGSVDGIHIHRSKRCIIHGPVPHLGQRIGHAPARRRGDPSLRL